MPACAGVRLQHADTRKARSRCLATDAPFRSFRTVWAGARVHTVWGRDPTVGRDRSDQPSSEDIRFLAEHSARICRPPLVVRYRVNRPGDGAGTHRTDTRATPHMRDAPEQLIATPHEMPTNVMELRTSSSAHSSTGRALIVRRHHRATHLDVLQQL
jgi:hypothetical protein